MEKGKLENDTKINKYSCACAMVASCISIIFGYDTGVMSGAMLFIKEEFKIGDGKVEVVAGIINLCALVGSLIAGRVSDYIGRRFTISLASVIFLAGSLVMGFAPSYSVLMLGRCVAGVGVGFALMIAPVYSAEISSPGTRGFLTSLPHLCISLGILLGYVSNFVFSKLSLQVGWRLMLGIAALPSGILALSIIYMPESPRWLVMQGRLKEAKLILLKVSNTKEEAETRHRDIKIAAGIDENCTDDVVTLKQKNRGQGVWKELLVRPSPTVRWILLAAVGVHFFEHAVGIEAVVLYSPRIFKHAGITSKDKLLLLTVGVGVLKATFILLATIFLDKIGRRKMLLTSLTGIIMALSTLGFALTIVRNSHDKLPWALSLSVAGVYFYVMFFSIGMGPVTWVYSSEIFPLKLRAQGASIGVAVNRVMNATVSMTFLTISEGITIGGTFFMFAGIAVGAWLFFFFFLPETKGRSLEEMEEVFSRGKNNKSSRNVEMEGVGKNGVQS